MSRAMAGGDRNGRACSLVDVTVFVVGLVSGTGCSLTSKMLLTCVSTGKTGEQQPFEQPLFQSWLMFVAMTCALPVHFAYEWHQRRAASAERAALTRPINASSPFPAKGGMPAWTYFILAVPACFDLVATVLCMFGLMYISVSVYQLLRGACIVFVALMKHYLLKDRQKGFQWMGVGLLALAISLVGLTSVLSASADTQDGARAGGRASVWPGFPVRRAGGGGSGPRAQRSLTPLLPLPSALAQARGARWSASC